MSETKHTPGPWVAENSSVIGPDNKIICGCIRGSIDRKSHEEDCATARLIAAAPDLLELATALLSAIERFAITNTSDEDTIGVLSDAAREAIAAATGATP